MSDEAKLEKLYRRAIAPAAEALRREHVELFPLRSDPTRATYFIKREPSDYIEAATNDPVQALQAQWHAGEHASLVRLASEVATVRAGLSVAEDEQADVPAFVYAMF